ncbi:GNAT family N-acetyltransferase [Alkalicoccobacillus plakortidis]|uniref:GNAT family N-acetyltransferase n=1 Tax=Alkalicoccobacillus plakortidis TaxID=444060 RepID=A0ABT0XN87_9BACI|nr:GNAT family N-acetyltransferase [Alkalicoccobacillus plakortidis]MCM2677371.1 GNAT family N-acetyltransferase [Alkalicoccobacillus plakortidis]
MKVSDVFYDLPPLETERLILRKVTVDDAEDMFEYTSVPDVSKYVPWQTHQTIEDTHQFIAFIMKQYESGKLAPWAIECKETSKVIGTFDFVTWYPQHYRAEIGFILSRDFWGKGLILEAAKEVTRFGFEHMNLNIIKAPCMTENVQSASVLQKLGMELEGVLKEQYYIKGQFRDMVIYSIKNANFKGTE